MFWPLGISDWRSTINDRAAQWAAYVTIPSWNYARSSVRNSHVAGKTFKQPHRMHVGKFPFRAAIESENQTVTANGR
jgi:hypothetical protein